MSETNTNTALIVKPVDRLKEVMAAPSVQEQFSNALKDNSSLFVASLIDLFTGEPTLQQCEPKLVVMEALKAATLKLPINKQLGFAYIIAYKKKKKINDKWTETYTPTFQIGYRGMVQLAMRTGAYKNINADCVYDGEYKGKNRITGEIDLTGTRKSDNVIGYFAYIEMLNGFSKILYMTKEEVIKHAEKHSKSYGNDGSAWKTDFDKMAMKTPLRLLLSKYGMMSVEMEQAVRHDDEDTFDAEYRVLANSETLAIPEPETDIDTGEKIDEQTGEVIKEQPEEKPTQEPVQQSMPGFAV